MHSVILVYSKESKSTNKRTNKYASSITKCAISLWYYFTLLNLSIPLLKN